MKQGFQGFNTKGNTTYACCDLTMYECSLLLGIHPNLVTYYGVKYYSLEGKGYVKRQEDYDCVGSLGVDAVLTQKGEALKAKMLAKLALVEPVVPHWV